MSAMKSYMKKKHLFHGVILCALTSILLFLCSFWFPSIEGTTLLPDMKNSIVNANCLFVVVNLIIVILVGESRLGGSRSEIKRPTDNGVYDEYVEKKRRSIRKGRGNQKSSVMVGVLEEKKERDKDDDGDVKVSEREDGDQEEDGLGKEELKRRVEEFIARVNEQRWVEARAF